MKKILLILAAVVGIAVLVWLLSYMIGFLWELFWVAAAISGIVYMVGKQGQQMSDTMIKK